MRVKKFAPIANSKCSFISSKLFKIRCMYKMCHSNPVTYNEDIICIHTLKMLLQFQIQLVP